MLGTKKILHALLVLAICGATEGAGETVKIEAKSFIAPIQRVGDDGTCMRVLAAFVSECTGENPQDGTQRAKDYRLWSGTTAEIVCDRDRISSWSFSNVDIAFGTEPGGLTPTGDLQRALNVKPASVGKTPTAKVEFSYRMRGRPAELAVRAMNTVKSRSCSYIWHEVSGTISCNSGRPVVVAAIVGSAFPSHRLWLNGQRLKDIAQGPFNNLWQCDAEDPTAVR